MAFIRFKSICQERVWGGRELETLMSRELSTDAPYGESWEVVDRDEAQSIVVGGSYDGLSLRELLEKHAATIMGPAWPGDQRFPILVKWLDCKERLSLQVHPPLHVAPELGGEPKTEAWYIVSCASDAQLIAGLKKGVTREQFEQALRNNELEPLCHRFGVSQGDHIFIPSGRIHAIDAGNLILEIQENSDTTYRVFDWGRVGLDGKPRQLHIEESLKSIDFDDYEPPVGRASSDDATIADCNEFKIQKLQLVAGETLSFAANEEPRLLGVVEGELESTDGETLRFGDNVLLPYAAEVELIAKVDSAVLLTDGFV